MKIKNGASGAVFFALMDFLITNYLSEGTGSRRTYDSRSTYDDSSNAADLREHSAAQRFSPGQTPHLIQTIAYAVPNLADSG